jgi:hypothetical protein
MCDEIEEEFTIKTNNGTGEACSQPRISVFEKDKSS